MISRAALLWFTAALTLRLSVMALAHLYSISAGYEGYYPMPSGHDDVIYYPLALDILAGDRPNSANYSYAPFSYALALWFTFTGPGLFAGKILNVLAGSATVYVGVRLVEHISADSKAKSNAAAHVAGAMLSAYPSALFYSTQLIKDPLLVLFGVVCFVSVVRILQAYNFGTMIGGLLAFAGVGLFRPYMAVAVAASVVIWTLLVASLSINRKLIIAFGSLTVAAVGPALIGMGPFAYDFFARVLTPEGLQAFRSAEYSNRGSSMNLEINFSSPASFLASYGYSYATALLGPFPWQLGSTAQLIGLPEACVSWLLTPFALTGLRRIARRRAGAEEMLLIFALLATAVIALFSDNIGANTRLRILPWTGLIVYCSTRLAQSQLLLHHGSGETVLLPLGVLRKVP